MFVNFVSCRNRGVKLSTLVSICDNTETVFPHDAVLVNLTPVGVVTYRYH